MQFHTCGRFLQGLFFFLALSLPIYAENQIKTPQEVLPLQDLQRFTGAVEQIRRYYVKPVEDKALFENAIRGMLSGLDPHSAYLDPSDFSELRAATSGKFGGLGIEVTLEDGFVRVVSPIDDTPASRAGIKAGDIIIKLDDAPVKGMTLKKAVEVMRGEKGTDIVLTIMRKGLTTPIKVKLTRDVINVKSVRTKLFDQNYGYIRVSQFQVHSGEDLIKAIDSLKKEANNNLKGIILDLRNNPGGIFESSVQISDAFLDKPKLNYNGLIVYTEGRLPGSEIKEFAQNGDVLKGAPMVVLVNGGSASASEIVAGALQDHKRALIVGTQTFGKGSVQTVLPLQEDYGIKLTTALYFTPSGRSIQAQGIKPDIEIADMKVEAKKDELDELIGLRESDLEGHLSAPSTESKKEAKESKESKTEKIATEAKAKPSLEEENTAILRQDYQLNESLNLLKGLVFLNKTNGNGGNNKASAQNGTQLERSKVKAIERGQ